MMDREQMIREMVAAYTAPLIADCERMRAGIDRAFPILLDRVARDAALADRNQLRERIELLLNDLHSIESRVLDAADERWPQWRE
jgi:hypothetical protein